MSNSVLVINGIEADKMYLVADLLTKIPVSKSHLYKCLKKHKVIPILFEGRQVYLGANILEFLAKLRREGEAQYYEKSQSAC